MKLSKAIFASLILLAAAIAAPSVSAQEEVAAEDQIMHTFGAIGAQAIFTNYMAIAELGDLFGAEAYDADKVTELATMYAGLATAAKESLSALIESETLGEGDDVAVKELIIINDHLVNLSKAIITYAADSSEENSKAYETSRQRAWKSISKYLEIE